MAIWWPSIGVTGVSLDPDQYRYFIGSDEFSRSDPFRSSLVDQWIPAEKLDEKSTYKIRSINRDGLWRNIEIEWYWRGVILNYAEALAYWGTIEEIGEKQQRERRMHGEHPEMMQWLER